MRKWLLGFLLLPLLATAQLKEFEVGELERPDVAVVQANAQWPDDALLLVYSSLKDLNFRSSLGGIDKVSYNNQSNRYEILFKPKKQMLFVYASNFIEQKIETFNPNAKDVFYYKAEERKSLDLRETGILNINTQPNGATITIDDFVLDGRTPKSLTLQEGTYKISVKLADYPAVDTIVQIDKKNTHFLDIILQSQSQTTLIALVKLKESNGWSYIDINGSTLINLDYGNGHSFSSDGLAPVETKGKYQFLQKDGRYLETEIQEFSLKSIFGFNLQGYNEGAVPIKVKKNWSYLNREGKISIDPIFDKLSQFNGGFAIGLIKQDFYIIDSLFNKVKIRYPKIEDVRRFSEGLAPLKENNQWCFINTKGEKTITAYYKSVGYFNQGRAWYKIKDGKYGFILKDGKKLTDAIFDSAKNFNSGYARVKYNGRWCFVDLLGTVKSIEYEEVKDFREGMAAVFVDGRWGFIDQSLGLAINPRYDSCKSFSNGIAAVKQNGLWGYIDKSGEQILEFKYSNAEDFMLID